MKLSQTPKNSIGLSPSPLKNNLCQSTDLSKSKPHSLQFVTEHRPYFIPHMILSQWNISLFSVIKIVPSYTIFYAFYCIYINIKTHKSVKGSHKIHETRILYYQPPQHVLGVFIYVMCV